MKVECTRGFGIVEHPDTGEEINVEDPFETDAETFAALDEAYPGFRVIEDDSEADDEPDICGVEMTDGNICQRPTAECPYH